MNTTFRILSPAVITACLALPLLAEQHKTDPAAPHHVDSAARLGSDATSSAVALGTVVRVSDIVGLEVRNKQDEKLGKVSDLAVDVAAGRIVEVIVSTGGVLGVGASLIAVPPAAFHYDHDAKVLHLDRTKESLKDLPAFDATQWNTHFQPTNVVAVYREYGVTPYFDADAVAADNTGLNRRDRDGRTLTPLDQGNSPGDLEITKQVRQAVMARDGLSVNAQNVKIITLNGRVTLRGPVSTEEEKSAIAEIAANSVAPANVDNQLEVKRSDTRN